MRFTFQFHEQFNIIGLAEAGLLASYPVKIFKIIITIIILTR